MPLKQAAVHRHFVEVFFINDWTVHQFAGHGDNVPLGESKNGFL